MHHALASPGGPKPRALVVDDEPGVLRVMAVVLRVGGFETDPFEHPGNAFRAFTRNPEGYDLLVTDVLMPGMLGTELAHRILLIRPKMPVIFVTGYADVPDLPHVFLLSRFAVLNKPGQVPLLKETAVRLVQRSAEL